MNTTQRRSRAIDNPQVVTRFNTILWALMQQGYEESKTRLQYKSDRQYLRDKYLNRARGRDRASPTVQLPPLPAR